MPRTGQWKFGCVFFFGPFLVQSLPRGEHVLNFSDAEELINDAELTEAQDEALEQELAVADRCVISHAVWWWILHNVKLGYIRVILCVTDKIFT